MVVVNLLGGPCCGKSTTAAGLFALLKLKTPHSTELVQEVVKSYVYDKNLQCLDDQVLMTAEQNHAIRRLRDTIDFVVTDASLLNGIVYGDHYDIDDMDVVGDMTMKLFNKYNNAVFLLPRKPKYDEYGRSQSLEEAKRLDIGMVNFLEFMGIQFYDMREFTHVELPEAIAEILARDFGLTMNDDSLPAGKPIC